MVYPALKERGKCNLAIKYKSLQENIAIYQHLISIWIILFTVTPPVSRAFQINGLLLIHKMNLECVKIYKSFSGVILNNYLKVKIFYLFP